MNLLENISIFDKIYPGMFITVLIILAIMLFACLIRAVKGPRIADRIVAINMMGTMVMVMIAVLSLLLREGYLVDICLIYAMVSFFFFFVISKVYLGVYKEKRQENEVEMSQMTGEGGDSDGNY
mgnify:CR=1 FL=1